LRSVICPTMPTSGASSPRPSPFVRREAVEFDRVAHHRDRHALLEAAEQQTLEAVGDGLRDGEHAVARREQREEANRRAERVARQQVVQVPDDRHAQARRRGGHHESGADAVGVNHVRLKLDDARSRLLDRAAERGEVARARAHAPREARFELFERVTFHALRLGHLPHRPFSRAEHERLEAAPVEVLEHGEQHALGPAHLRRVVVEKYSHTLSSIAFAPAPTVCAAFRLVASALTQPIRSQPTGAHE
jgi:hypothetical protein